MSSKIIFSFFLLLGLALFYLSFQQTDLATITLNISEFSLLGFLIYLSISLTNFTVFVGRWYIIIKALSIPVPLHKLWGYRISGYAVSYLTPAAQIGGEPVRIYLLQHYHHIPIKTSTTTVLIDKMLEISVNLIFIFLGVFWAVFLGLNLNVTGFIIILGLFLSIFIYILLALIHEWGIISVIIIKSQLNKIPVIQTYLPKIQAIETEITNFFKKHPLSLISAISLSILTQLFICLEIFILLTFLGIPPNFSQIFLIATIPQLAFLIPTPGALGSLEGSYALVFKILNIIQIPALSMVLIIRIRDLILVCLGIGYAMTHSIKIYTFFLHTKINYDKNKLI